LIFSCFIPKRARKSDTLLVRVLQPDWRCNDPYHDPAWFRKRCFWVTQASGIIPLFKAELVSNAILLEVVDLH